MTARRSRQRWMFPLMRRSLHLRPSIEGQTESRVKSAKASDFNSLFYCNRSKDNRKGERRYWQLTENTIFSSPDVYPAAECSTVPPAPINSNLILLQCLTNEADQDHSSVTSWLKHVESCNIHSHQRTEEWKQSLTKAVTETKYIGCYHQRSVALEREFHFICACMWQTHALVN